MNVCSFTPRYYSCCNSCARLHLHFTLSSLLYIRLFPRLSAAVVAYGGHVPTLCCKKSTSRRSDRTFKAACPPTNDGVHLHWVADGRPLRDIVALQALKRDNAPLEVTASAGLSSNYVKCVLGGGGAKHAGTRPHSDPSLLARSPIKRATGPAHGPGLCGGAGECCAGGCAARQVVAGHCCGCVRRRIMRGTGSNRRGCGPWRTTLFEMCCVQTSGDVVGQGGGRKPAKCDTVRFGAGF